MQKYIDVILPLPLANSYTYALPLTLSTVQIGCRVIVPFGKKKYYTAVALRIHEDKPEGYLIKEVLEVLDDGPVVTLQQLKLWQWIAEYYLCTLGEVYKAAMPGGMKLESETSIKLNADYEAEAILSEKEQRILDLLSSESEQNINKLQRDSGVKHIMPVINSLLNKGALYIKEGIQSRYKPKTETNIRLAQGYSDERTLNIILQELKKAPKQQSLLITFLDISGYSEADKVKSVSKKKLLEAVEGSSAALSALLKKGILEAYLSEVGRLNTIENTEDAHELSGTQQKAYAQIIESFQEKNVCLLYGVTSCGKTEIYIHLMQDIIQKGKQVLFLLPEIALTTQITERLLRVFGSRLGVYHSKLSDAERVEIWQKQLSDNPYDIIIGVRSSIFLPFRNLSLIIVDEEHDGSYKQQDPAPRYNARNSAIMLAFHCGAKVLLGTATPCLESFYNVEKGKYGLVEIKERYQAIHLPRIEVVDSKELKRKKRMKGALSPLLITKMKEALERKEQIILFQNRRGYAPFVECKVCGWIPKCKNCDVSLTYHRATNQLTCHYCGYTYRLPDKCPACEGEVFDKCGFGTERIEDEVSEVFPEARIVRMDMDTTRSKHSYERIISDFAEGRVDILIGTQMVAKGLDFDHVSIVGILNADTMLNYPDFRAYEKAFQLLTQVAGRAGRKNKQGTVILQTKDTKLPIINQVITNDFASFYQMQLDERKLFCYPPYYRLVYLFIKHRDEQTLDSLSHLIADELRTLLGNRVLGPDRPPVARIQLLYIRKIVLKIEVTTSMLSVRQIVTNLQSQVRNDERYRSAIVYFDVDPL